MADADTVLLDRYIPAGCLGVSRKEVLRQDGDDDDTVRTWAAPCRTWQLAVHEGSVVSADGPHLNMALQAALLDTPALAILARLFRAQWTAFSFCVDANQPDQGICRVYILPDDAYRRVVPRESGKLRRDLQTLLKALDYAPAAWAGEWDVLTTTPMLGAEANSTEDDQTLLHMFNTIPSPQPSAEVGQDGWYAQVFSGLATSQIPGLQTKLYAYQSRSAAVMLQRELCPGRGVDPRLQQVADQAGRAWFYDDVTGEVLRQARYYDNVSGGILAEEMGTGKTLICLSLILATRAFPAEMPEVCRGPADGSGGSGVRRPRVGSLADMAAAVVTRQAVPWKLYLAGPDADHPTEYDRCVAAIERNPAVYAPDEVAAWQTSGRAGRRTEGDETARHPAVTLSSGSLVIVPANLVRQWQQEVDKHTAGLRVLVVAGQTAEPDVAALLQADVVLYSMPRFEQLARARQTTRGGQTVLQSSLAAVHWKRVIVDEGHRLGNSRLGAKSNLLLVLELLQVSARWVVTGTPSRGLFGVDEGGTTDEKDEKDAKEAGTQNDRLGASSDRQERQDLERIGAMASMYLRMRPWANSAAEVGRRGATDRPADWAVYVMQPRHSRRSGGRRGGLRATLDALIIRHRRDEVGDLLPAVDERTVRLEGSFQDRLCTNLFAMMIVCNAVQSQRRDQDYLFHPSQRGALLQLVSNMRQATFFGGFFYATDEIGRAVETAEKFLASGRVAVDADDAQALREAIAFGTVARTNRFKRLLDDFHEVPVYVQDFPGGAAARAWAMDGEGKEGGEPGDRENQGDATLDKDHMTCTAAPMIRALQQFLRPCMDAPHTLQMLFADGRFARHGAEERAKARGHGAPPAAPSTGPPAPSLAGAARPGDDGGNALKRRGAALGHPDEGPVGDDDVDRDVAAPLARARLVATASAKLSYLLDAIVRHQADEQMIVFYEHENTAFYLAEHLEVLQIRHLIYARGISAARRARYVETFNGNARFRVLLMDLSQAAFGLDMRSASRVYFVGPVLNPQVAAQAIGRVRRISQQRQVAVETLVLRDSLEELLVERRGRLTQAEHRTMKTILDDRPIRDWILHARVRPLPSLPADAAPWTEMAALATPQCLFGRGVGRVEHPDEGLLDVAGEATEGTASTTAATEEATATESKTASTTGTASETSSATATPPEPPKKKARLQVRFAE